MIFLLGGIDTLILWVCHLIKHFPCARRDSFGSVRSPSEHLNMLVTGIDGL